MNGYINIHCIDNFQFFLTYLILCILDLHIYIYIYIYIIPKSYPIPLTVTICNKDVFVHEWINSMPIATPSPFLWSLLSWAIQYFSVHKLNWEGKGYAWLWIIQKELMVILLQIVAFKYIIQPQYKCHE